MRHAPYPIAAVNGSTKGWIRSKKKTEAHEGPPLRVSLGVERNYSAHEVQPAFSHLGHFSPHLVQPSLPHFGQAAESQEEQAVFPQEAQGGVVQDANVSAVAEVKRRNSFFIMVAGIVWRLRE